MVTNLENPQRFNILTPDFEGSICLEGPQDMEYVLLFVKNEQGADELTNYQFFTCISWCVLRMLLLWFRGIPKMVVRGWQNRMLLLGYQLWQLVYTIISNSEASPNTENPPLIPKPPSHVM